MSVGSGSFGVGNPQPCFEVFFALLWSGGGSEWVGVIEVNVAVGIHSDELAFAQVEFEVVLCCCGLDVVQSSLYSVC